MSDSMMSVVKYDAGGVEIKLEPETVKNYLVRGNGKVTDQEVLFFIRTCQAQRLNPLVYGEVYLIKFGNEPAQLVIGKETYMKRAFKNPNYNGMKSGIVVQRGEAIIQKEGTCLYPSEVLLGGWCRVYHELNGKDTETFKEVSLIEYQKFKDGKPMANWGSKPCTMIEKVAVSQAVRAAFPDDYQGLYTAEEFGYTDRDAEKGVSLDGNAPVVEEGKTEEEVVYISQAQRQEFLELATGFYGKRKGSAVVKYICTNMGLESTTNMTVGQFEEAMETLRNGIEADKRNMKEQEESGEEGTDESVKE